MKRRPATLAVVAVAALGLTLAGCTTDPVATGEDVGGSGFVGGRTGGLDGGIHRGFGSGECGPGGGRVVRPGQVRRAERAADRHL